MPARAVPGAPVGSTVAIGTVSGLKRKELGGDCNGGGVDGRSSDDGDDGLRDNRGDERGSCFFRSSLRTIVVPKIRSKQRAQAQINQAEKEEERREWKKREQRRGTVFFRSRSLAKTKSLFPPEISSVFPLSLSVAHYRLMASIDLPALPEHLVLRHLQKSDFEKGSLERERGDRILLLPSFLCLDRSQRQVRFFFLQPRRSSHPLSPSQ